MAINLEENSNSCEWRTNVEILTKEFTSEADIVVSFRSQISSFPFIQTPGFADFLPEKKTHHRYHNCKCFKSLVSY